ncbi:hypothetical protein TKK_0012513 [Trichogramma kaykai]|uniref:RING-type domain-containing protein n=1 Tax=Trichogramma kaykai TaxID=54128 RepID=A0ABD2WN82_9HYME
MEVLPGKQANTIIYYYKGYLYHRDNRSGTIFRCARRQKDDCDARLYVQHRNDIFREEAICQAGVHFCQKMDVYVLRLKFIKELEELAGSSYDGLKEIYDRLKRKEMYTPLQNLRNVRFDLFKQKMLKARREFVPKTPDTLLELGQLLMDYPPLRSFYKGQATVDDGSVAQIFINDDMLAPLNKITEIFCDGTFKIRCKQPKCAQIFTLHFRKVDMGFPSIICMTSSMTTSMYDAIWKKLFEIIPDLQRNIQTIHMDFERAQIKSAKKHFPSPKRVSGCLFHYKQAIAKKWSRLRVPTNYNYILEYTYALAHLPAHLIGEGMNEITSLIDNLSENLPERVKLHNFASYLRRFWLPLAKVFSVYGQPFRTNNTCENFHYHATKLLGAQPRVWKLLHVLEKMMKSYAIDYGKVAKGGRIRSLNLPANERTLDLQIIQVEEDLAIERYTVREFLGYIASLRRLDVARTNLYYAQLQWCGRNRVVGRPDPEEEEEEEEEIEEITQTDIQYIQENLNADSGPGGTFEIEVAERRARRTQMIRISQNMSDPNDNAPNQPSTEQQSIPAGRIGRARMNASVAPSANIEQNEAAPEQEQVPARRRGRPRRNVSVAPSENVEENEAAAEQEQVPARKRGRPRTNTSAASSVNVVQNEAAGEQQQVPVRRRGRPRTSASAASSVNVEQNEAAGEQAPVPTRRRGRPRTDASAASSVNVDQNEPTGEQLPVPARRRGQQPHVNLIDALEASTDEENDDDPRITSTDHNSTDENIGAMDNIESIDINDILTTEESAFNASTMQAPSMLDQEMNEVGNERIENLDLQNQNDVRFGEQEANTSPIASALVLVNANAINTREAKNDDDSGIPRKKRRRNPRKKCQLLSCEAKFRVRKLDCGHRYCVPCIRNFISRFCPQCRKPIVNYLPPELMGGERWELGEDQQLDREFAHQTTRERIDLINSTRRLGIDIEDLYQ